MKKVDNMVGAIFGLKSLTLIQFSHTKLASGVREPFIILTPNQSTGYQSMKKKVDNMAATIIWLKPLTLNQFCTLSFL